jgi:hypothetical protein
MCAAQRVKGEEECKMCELMTTLIEEFLSKGLSASQIIAELKKICSKLPGGLAGICDGFVESGVVTKIIGELTNGTAPHEVCTQLHLCAAMVRPPPKEVKVKGEEECKVCELMTTLIEEFLSKGLSASQIIAELKKICSKLPGGLAGICDGFVESGIVTKIIGELTNGTSPQEVCTQLHLCASTMTMPKKMPPPRNLNVKVKGEEECKVCELLTTLIEEFLSKGLSASQIIAELKKVCSKLPGGLAGICDGFVESGIVTKIIGELTNGTSPQEVCTQLHLCPLSKRSRTRIEESRLRSLLRKWNARCANWPYLSRNITSLRRT